MPRERAFHTENHNKTVYNQIKILKIVHQYHVFLMCDVEFVAEFNQLWVTLYCVHWPCIGDDAAISGPVRDSCRQITCGMCQVWLGTHTGFSRQIRALGAAISGPRGYTIQIWHELSQFAMTKFDIPILGCRN